MICWPALDPTDPALVEARQLYETAIEPAERIPWAWVEAAVRERRSWRPGAWAPRLFLVPRDTPPEAFDAAALRAVAAGLLEHVYGRGPGDRLHRLTLPPGCEPVLRPVGA